MSSTGTINMVTNVNTNNLHKVNTNTSTSSSTSSQDSSTSSTAIYIDDPIDATPTQIDDNNTHNNHIVAKSKTHSKPNNIKLIQNNHYTINELTSMDDNTSIPTHNHTNKYQRFHKHNSSLFGHDYIKNFVILSKLYSTKEYYNNLPLSQLPFINNKKIKGSDCPSDISSLDSRRKRKRSSKQSKIRKFITWFQYINSTICDIIKLSCDFIILSFNKFQKWQKELHEAPIEVKEKYFFIVSTIISTVLFYILFLCLDIMIKHWFALPKFITEYSFSISYCISYLTSVIWQHFFNQYFVFAVFNNNTANTDTFCDSLFRTYLVYGCSLMMTGIIGSILQIYVGIADEFILFLTLPISGIMNYYLLRYCHNKHTHHNINLNGYQLLPQNENKYNHRKVTKINHKSARHHKGFANSKKYTHQNKKHNPLDDIVIV